MSLDPSGFRSHGLIIGAVYANTMLAMLNARQTMRNKSDVIDTVELSGQRRTHRTSMVGGQLVSRRRRHRHSAQSLTLAALQGTRVEIFKETSMITDSHVSSLTIPQDLC